MTPSAVNSNNYGMARRGSRVIVGRLDSLGDAYDVHDFHAVDSILSLIDTSGTATANTQAGYLPVIDFGGWNHISSTRLYTFAKIMPELNPN